MADRATGSEKNKWRQQYREYLLPGLAVLVLLISCAIVSSKKYFWNDELLSFYLLDDRSFFHMLVAWSDKFNQAPPFYFILGWVWDKLFGSTELPLRLFSSMTIGLACLTIWTVLRRTYDFWSTTIGTLSVFCLSELVLYHNAELRMYGLFTAVCAFGLLQFDSINRNQKLSRKSLSINSITHGLIVLTHLYGVFYSTAILGSFLIRDRYFKVFRINVYLSVLAGWIILIPLAPLIINQSNNSAKWFYAFTFPETINLLTPFTRFPSFMLALFLIAALLFIVESGNNGITQNDSLKQSSKIHLLILALSFILVPITAWVITVTLKPLLNDRYILPTIAIGWSILLTDLASRIIPESQQPKIIKGMIGKKFGFSVQWRSLILFTLILVLILHPLYYAKKYSEYAQKPGKNDFRYGHLDLPIAMEAGHDFLPRFYYSSKPSRYFHILDLEIAEKNVGSAYATGDYVHLNALSKNYPFIQSVQSSDFLNKYDRFLVMNEDDQKWFEWRVQNNPAYKVQKLGVEQGANAPLTVFLVERQAK